MHSEKNKLKARPCRLTPVTADRLYLESAGTRVLLEGRDIRRIIDELWPLLNGGYSEGEILALLPKEYLTASENILTSLTTSGLIMARPADDKVIDGPSAQIAFFESSFGKPDIQTKLNRAVVFLVGENPLADATSAELKKAGVSSLKQIVPSGNTLTLSPEADVVILCLSRQDKELRNLVNQTCFTHGLPWLLTLAEGREGWVGPFVIPGETACNTCLESRLRANSFFPDDRRHSRPLTEIFETDSAFASLIPFYTMVASMASLEVIRHITAMSQPVTYGGQLVVDGITGSFRHEVLHRVPRCPQCSTIGEQRSSITAFWGESDVGV